jgi:predicted enzyme related to lactoylglutathione lyase
LSDDFAIVPHDGMAFQVHSDGTYGAHPLLGLVPEMPPRGAGAQFYLFWIDPDAAAARAEGSGAHVVIEPPGQAARVARMHRAEPRGLRVLPAVHAG